MVQGNLNLLLILTPRIPGIARLELSAIYNAGTLAYSLLRRMMLHNFPNNVRVVTREVSLHHNFLGVSNVTT